MIRLGNTANCSSLGNVLNVLVWTEVAATALWVLVEARASRRRPDGTATAADPPAVVLPPTPSGPVEAHLQISRACPLPCPACHIDPTPGGPVVALADVEARLRRLAQQGVLRVALGGGEALHHPDLPAILGIAQRLGLGLGLTTSGVGLTDAHLDVLRGFAQVNVSFDGMDAVFAQSRGYTGAPAALTAIQRLAGAGVRTGVNVVLDRYTLPALPQTVAAVVAAGAHEVQVLRLKPAGRGREAYEARRLSPAQRLQVWPTLQGIIEQYPDIWLRADCALVPFIAAHQVDLARAARFGLQGCVGGEVFVSVDTEGATHPCSFTQVSSFSSDKTPCDGCAYQPLCRGGCHVVAAHLTGDPLAPDPECPLVNAA